MKKILCPTDYSKAALNAIAYAAKFAQVTNSELNLFHVESVFDLTPLELVKGKEQVAAMLTEQLENQCQEVSKTFKISCYANIEFSGYPLASVIEKKGSEFDLILMGTNGVTDYFDFFTGSNTYKVIKKSSTPVLLIPANCEYEPISKIIFAADFLKGDYVPLGKLIRWVKLLESKLSVLQIIQGHYSHEKEVALKRDQAEISDFYSDEITIEFNSIWSTEIASSIHSHVLRTQSDALALCTKHQGLLEDIFHKSVIKVISSIASYPVFVFH